MKKRETEKKKALMAANPFQQDGAEAAFLSLPRLAGRLTAELIMRSPQGLNPSKEYALDLRGERGTKNFQKFPPNPSSLCCVRGALNRGKKGGKKNGRTRCVR